LQLSLFVGLRAKAHFPWMAAPFQMVIRDFLSKVYTQRSNNQIGEK
jgi:hypothetical protein